MTGSLLLLALTGICVVTYAWLDPTAPRVLALPMLGAGALVAVLGLVSAGRRVQRTRYRPDPWRSPELAVVSAYGKLTLTRQLLESTVPVPHDDLLPALVAVHSARGVAGLTALDALAARFGLATALVHLDRERSAVA